MATSYPGLNGQQDLNDYTSDHGLSSLSLSSKTVHADDFLNKGQDVAPPLHVSTTFRYSNNPDELVALSDLDVRISPHILRSHDPTSAILCSFHLFRSLMLTIRYSHMYLMKAMSIPGILRQIPHASKQSLAIYLMAQL